MIELELQERNIYNGKDKICIQFYAYVQCPELSIILINVDRLQYYAQPLWQMWGLSAILQGVGIRQEINTHARINPWAPPSQK